jgi:hypothetical protein
LNYLKFYDIIGRSRDKGVNKMAQTDISENIYQAIDTIVDARL